MVDHKMRLVFTMAAVATICAITLPANPAQANTRAGVTPTTGIRDTAPNVHAIVGARIVPRPGHIIESGTVVLRNGRIQAVGPAGSVKVPADARIWDGTGRTVYAGLIEPSSHMGLPDAAAMRQVAGSHWNERILAELTAAALYRPDPEALKALRGNGFTAALVVPQAGLFHGRSALVSTADGVASDVLLRSHVAQHVSLKNPGTPSSTWAEVLYPGSLMGAIALTRQTLLDADWYARIKDKPTASQLPPAELAALEALAAVVDGKELVVLDVRDDRVLRIAEELQREFGLRVAIRGGGAEYRQLPRLSRLDVPVILPLTFPEAPDVSDPEDALATSLTSLWHWESAPANAGHVRRADVAVALTSDGLDKPADFPARVRQTMQAGLSADDALAAVTTVPAQILGVSQQLGTIERGRLAHLTITDGDLFGDGTSILDLWIDGERYVINEPPEHSDLRGSWQLELPEVGQLIFEITGSSAKAADWKASITRDSVTIASTVLRLEGRRLTLAFAGDSLGQQGIVRLSGLSSQALISGTGITPAGTSIQWQARRSDEPTATDDGASNTEAEVEAPSVPPMPPFPPVSYAADVPDQPAAVLVRNGTVWTSGPAGILSNTDVLIRKGRIAAVGPDLKAPADAVIVNATGKHVTPGLVDAHVHISAMGGLNEWTQAISAEVRVRDALNPYDGRIYRHMAQGTTTVHVMHGSSNPIGGQNVTMKLRWGADVEDLLLASAAPTIKFALGENVKHSNRGQHFTTRYPQTRMGVLALIEDRMIAAQEYGERRQLHKSTRGDLELDALVEVLDGSRLVHCHSYRQDEILGLIRVAEASGFTIGTFQHVLEGYKVAEAIAAHGAGASTFSDWWGYKFEVIDAMPYNAAIMHFVGVGVSLNSDLSNYGGRIHVDAAKAVKYGGVSPEAALHMVTIEPARQLGADDRVGSLEPGKDADFVLWSHSPMSSFTRCEQTWIDGRRYFDLGDDAERRQQVEVERNRLLQAVLTTGDRP